VPPGYGNPDVHYQKTRKEKLKFNNNLPYHSNNRQQFYNSDNPAQVTYQGKNYRRLDNFKGSVREDMFGPNFVTIDRPSSSPNNQKK
jgi:hypothetical protein